MHRRDIAARTSSAVVTHQPKSVRSLGASNSYIDFAARPEVDWFGKERPQAVLQSLALGLIANSRCLSVTEKLGSRCFELRGGSVGSPSSRKHVTETASLGGDDRKVVRQSARSASKPSDRTRSISASTASRSRDEPRMRTGGPNLICNQFKFFKCKGTDRNAIVFQGPDRSKTRKT
jgi:hypothetical protein